MNQTITVIVVIAIIAWVVDRCAKYEEERKKAAQQAYEDAKAQGVQEAKRRKQMKKMLREAEREERQWEMEDRLRAGKDAGDL